MSRACRLACYQQHHTGTVHHTPDGGQDRKPCLEQSPRLLSCSGLMEERRWRRERRQPSPSHQWTKGLSGWAYWMGRRVPGGPDGIWLRTPAVYASLACRVSTSCGSAEFEVRTPGVGRLGVATSGPTVGRLWKCVVSTLAWLEMGVAPRLRVADTPKGGKCPAGNLSCTPAVTLFPRSTRSGEKYARREN